MMNFHISVCLFPIPEMVAMVDSGQLIMIGWILTCAQMSGSDILFCVLLSVGQRHNLLQVHYNIFSIEIINEKIIDLFLQLNFAFEIVVLQVFPL